MNTGIPIKKIVLKICKVSDDQKNYGSAWSGDGLGGCVDGDDNSGNPLRISNIGLPIFKVPAARSMLKRFHLMINL